MAALITIAEVPEFVRRAGSLLSPEERMALLEYLAANPRAGDLIPGAGGVRGRRPPSETSSPASPGCSKQR